ncbi:MAG: hypothetical protein ACTHK5_04580 [Tsuneonella sp.]
MDDFSIQVAGRFTALEFVLEVMLANNLAHMPEEVSEQFKSDLVSRPGYIKRGPMDADAMQAIQAECTAVLARFVEKVSEREAELREKL